MSTVHRRILPAKEARCTPSPDCQFKENCARYKCPLPQGIGATMGNFRGTYMYTDEGMKCPRFISDMVSDEELAAQQKTVKPPIGNKV
jgi:hypothetical protein